MNKESGMEMWKTWVRSQANDRIWHGWVRDHDLHSLKVLLKRLDRTSARNAANDSVWRVWQETVR